MMRNTSKTSKDATAVGFLGPHGSRGVQFDSDSAEFGGSNSFNEQNSSTISSDIKCGDMQPIAREFRQHYEKKLKEAAADNSGDGVQVKMKLQEDWIRDLTEQNDMLIRAVLELETEATERVKMLEEKLKESAACACEVMDGWRGREQTQAQLSSDVHNLLQLIQRARTSNSPSGDSSTASLTAGLHFYHVTERDLATALQPSVTQSTEQTDEVLSHDCACAHDRKMRVTLEILEAHEATHVCHCDECKVDLLPNQMGYAEPLVLPKGRSYFCSNPYQTSVPCQVRVSDCHCLPNLTPARKIDASGPYQVRVTDCRCIPTM